MKAADFPRSTEIAPPSANGEHPPARKNGAAAKRSAGKVPSANAPASDRSAGKVPSANAPASERSAGKVPSANSPASERSAGKSALGNSPAPEPLAGPVGSMEDTAIDAPMWPLQSAVWFQPDVAPAPPAWSSLAIERHNRIPAPDFAPSDTSPANRPGALEHSPEALTRAAVPEAPESGLTPLGWDPRADCWKEKSK